MFYDERDTTVLEPLLLVIDTVFQDSVSCNGLFDGSASVAVSEEMGYTVIYGVMVRLLLQLVI